MSYRRGPESGFAHALYQRLVKAFGRERIFFDVDHIPLGENFTDVISKRLSESDVTLVLIGPDWASTKDARGLPRLQNDGDFVRREVEAAIDCGQRIIPVLLNGAEMPKRNELPESMRSLTDFQAIEVRHTDFEAGISRLLKRLKHIFAGSAPESHEDWDVGQYIDDINQEWIAKPIQLKNKPIGVDIFELSGASGVAALKLNTSINSFSIWRTVILLFAGILAFIGIGTHPGLYLAGLLLAIPGFVMVYLVRTNLLTITIGDDVQECGQLGNELSEYRFAFKGEEFIVIMEYVGKYLEIKKGARTLYRRGAPESQ